MQAIGRDSHGVHRAAARSPRISMRLEQKLLDIDVFFWCIGGALDGVGGDAII
jgi:hypothetical protein